MSASGAQAPEPPHGILLDVGHGNAAVFIDGDVALVVDAGPGDLVADTLERHEISEITAIVVSHRHHDHTSELPSLLANPELCVRRLFLNADPSRDPTTRFERALRAGFNDSVRRNQTELQQANETIGHHMNTANLQVEVLTPSAELAMGGVGSPAASGGTVDPHAFAVVARVSMPAGRSVLLGADLDHDGFRELLDKEGVDLSADLFAYPHHGGLTGAGSDHKESELATNLTEAIRPEIVFFSNGRDRYDNPRREVVRGVRAAETEPRARIVCTQLSQQCSALPVPTAGRLDESLDSVGATGGLSCSGSIRIDLARDGPILPQGRLHLEFVLNQVGDQAMCLAASGDLAG